MSSTNVIRFAPFKAERDAEKQFTDFVQNSIENDRESVRPIPSSIFDRLSALEAKMAKVQAEEELMEG